MAVSDEQARIRKQAAMTNLKELSMTSSEVTHKYQGRR